MSENNNTKFKKVGFVTISGVVCLWFSTHAGGGFASGNSVSNYFVQYGWTAAIGPVITFALLAFCYRQVMVMTNNHNCQNYSELFAELWKPYPKLAITFEIYFFVMLICAVGAAIAGAAQLLTEMGGVPYLLSILIVSFILLMLSIFGPTLLARAATAMSIVILGCCFIIYFMGIAAKGDEIIDVITNFKGTSADGFTDHAWWALLNSVITYAGFQCGVVPALSSVSPMVKTKKNATKSMVWGGILNAVALTLPCLMLLGWYSVTKGSQIPMLVACQAMGGGFLSWLYAISLFLCFVSTGVSLIYGLVPRFENARPMKKVHNLYIRRSIISIIGMVVPALFSTVGLSNVVAYGYQFAGLMGFFVLLLPLAILGTYKNKKFSKEHPEGSAIETEYLKHLEESKAAKQ